MGKTRTKKILLSLFLASCLAVSGCELFQPQTVRLYPDEIAAIALKAGELNSTNLDAWIRQASKELQVPVESVRKTADGIEVTVKSAFDELMPKAGKTITSALETNPTPTALIGIILGLGAAVASTLTRRSELAKRKEKANGGK